MKLELDGQNLSNWEQMHEEIARQLDLPEYYGKNLDALWDVLTEWSEPLEITVQNSSFLLHRFGERSATVLQLFQDAAEENAAISVEMEI